VYKNEDDSLDLFVGMSGKNNYNFNYVLLNLNNNNYNFYVL
jgi:hypothetical protein